MFARAYFLAALAACVAIAGALPAGPQRDSITGKKVTSQPPTSNTTVPAPPVVNNATINGTNGADDACSRGLTAWCFNKTRRDIGDDNEFFRLPTFGDAREAAHELEDEIEEELEEDGLDVNL